MATFGFPPDKPPTQWSTVTKNQANLAKLDLLTTNLKILSKEGYVFEHLKEQELWSKMRCVNCGQRMKHFRPPLSGDVSLSQAQMLDAEAEAVPEGRSTKVKKKVVKGTVANRSTEIAGNPVEQKHFCMYHDGDTFNGVWQCCGGRSNTRGCCSNPTHTPCDLRVVKKQWFFQKTVEPQTSPPPAPEGRQQPDRSDQGDAKRARGIRQRYANPHPQFMPPAPVRKQKPKDIRDVVTLDCEMGSPKVGTSLDSVLIRISLVDFFTCQTLIDSLVAPDIDMQHYNTRYSGVTFAMMRNAVRRGEAIQGLKAARELFMKYVDASTIIIMHGGQSDLKALRIIHPAHKIIDTYVLESYYPSKEEQGQKKSLKDVCMRRCGIVVQDAKLANGRAAGHDSMEDALAAREIVCAWLKKIPDEQAMSPFL